MGWSLIAYGIDDASVEAVVDILGVFHGGQDWEAALGDAQATRRRADDTSVRGKKRGRRTVGDHSRPTVANAFAQVSRTMSSSTNSSH